MSQSLSRETNDSQFELSNLHNLQDRLEKHRRRLSDHRRGISVLQRFNTLARNCWSDLDSLLCGLPEIMRSLSDNPEKSSALVEFKDRLFVSKNFRQTHWSVEAIVFVEEISEGRLVLYYQNEPAFDRMTSLGDDSVLETLASRLGGIAERIRVTRKLQEERDLLEKKNIAMQELAGEVTRQRKHLAREVCANADSLVIPVLHRLREKVPDDVKSHVDEAIKQLQNLTSPFASHLQRIAEDLTPAELRICDAIRSGLTSKEIADREHISPFTVNRHRENIRRKLGLAGRRVNLASYLSRISKGNG